MEKINDKKNSLQKCLTDLLSRTSPVLDTKDDMFQVIKYEFKSYRAFYREMKDKKKTDVVEKLDAFANEIIPKFIEELEKLLNNSESSEGKALLFRFSGDMKRYMVEFNEENVVLKTTYIQESLIAYREAMNISEKLPHESYGRLATIMNFVVLLADEMRLVDEAIETASQAIEAVKGKNLTEETTVIIDLLKDNIKYWENNREAYLNGVKFG